MNPVRTIRWLGMGITIPDDWEIAKHSVKVDRGQLSFVDRRHQRLQVGWTACKRRPDEKWIFEDFRARDLHNYPDCELGPVFRFEKWTGYYRQVDGKGLTRAGTFDRKLNRWIDVAIPWGAHAARDEEFEKQFLHNFRFVSPEQGMQHIDAFDIHVSVPESWVLTRAEVGPADTIFTFSTGRGEAKVRRKAMPEAWFDGHLEHFLAGEIGDWKGTLSFSSSGVHEICESHCKERTFHFRWLTGKRKARTDWAWHCPENHAVYQVTTFFSSHDPVSPGELRVRCCGKREEQQ